MATSDSKAHAEHGLVMCQSFFKGTLLRSAKRADETSLISTKNAASSCCDNIDTRVCMVSAVIKATEVPLKAPHCTVRQQPLVGGCPVLEPGKSTQVFVVLEDKVHPNKVCPGNIDHPPGSLTILNIQTKGTTSEVKITVLALQNHTSYCQNCSQTQGNCKDFHPKQAHGKNQ